MSRPTEWIALLLVPLGMAFSYATRARPPEWVKLAVALGAVGSLVWFFHEVSTRPVTDITTVENPLTVLFVCILVVHSFHVPARRDLLFSLGASAGLMAVGAAQAIDLHYGIYALAWVAFVLWALIESWTSASHGGRTSAPGVGTALLMVTLAATAIFLVLPAPIVAVHINFLDRAGSGGAVPVPGALAGDGASAHRAVPGGEPIRSDPCRRLPRIRQHPGYGPAGQAQPQGGHAGPSAAAVVLGRRNLRHLGRPELVGVQPAHGDDRQQLAVCRPDAARHQRGGADRPADLLRHHFHRRSDLPRRERLRGVVPDPVTLLFSGRHHRFAHRARARGHLHRAISGRQRYPESATPGHGGRRSRATSCSATPSCPTPTPRSQALAESVTAGATTTYDRVQDLIGWIGANTHYSTAIPPLPPGADTVDEFLFGNRTGYCEQISTALAVMLRTLGIPVREVVGYVPGPYNPVTDLYTVEADDAHAWVQVWIPGYGWQSFDPTASVPLANPDPGATALHDVAGALAGIPLWPAAVVLAVAGLAAVVVRSASPAPGHAGRNRSPIPSNGPAAGPDAPGGRARPSSSTPRALDDLLPDGSDTCRRLAADVEASAYGGREPPPEIQRLMMVSARRIRIPRRRRSGRSRPPASTSRRPRDTGGEASPASTSVPV